MLLEVRDLHVFYDDFHVLHGVSLDVGEGELVGIVGANGHGKSTLLKAICGLTPVRSGTVQYQHARIDNVSAPDLVAKGLVYVPEVRNLFGGLQIDFAFLRHRNLKATQLQLRRRLTGAELHPAIGDQI